jgi:hypothetical protein
MSIIRKPGSYLDDDANKKYSIGEISKSEYDEYIARLPYERMFSLEVWRNLIDAKEKLENRMISEDDYEKYKKYLEYFSYSLERESSSELYMSKSFIEWIKSSSPDLTDQTHIYEVTTEIKKSLDVSLRYHKFTPLQAYVQESIMKSVNMYFLKFDDEYIRELLKTDYMLDEPPIDLSSSRKKILDEVKYIIDSLRFYDNENQSLFVKKLLKMYLDCFSVDYDYCKFMMIDKFDNIKKLVTTLISLIESFLTSDFYVYYDIDENIIFCATAIPIDNPPNIIGIFNVCKNLEEIGKKYKTKSIFIDFMQKVESDYPGRVPILSLERNNPYFRQAFNVYYEAGFLPVNDIKVSIIINSSRPNKIMPMVKGTIDRPYILYYEPAFMKFNYILNDEKIQVYDKLLAISFNKVCEFNNKIKNIFEEVDPINNYYFKLITNQKDSGFFHKNITPNTIIITDIVMYNTILNQSGLIKKYDYSPFGNEITYGKKKLFANFLKQNIGFMSYFTSPLTFNDYLNTIFSDSKCTLESNDYRLLIDLVNQKLEISITGVKIPSFYNSITKTYTESLSDFYNEIYNIYDFLTPYFTVKNEYTCYSFNVQLSGVFSHAIFFIYDKKSDKVHLFDPGYNTVLTENKDDYNTNISLFVKRISLLLIMLNRGKPLIKPSSYEIEIMATCNQLNSYKDRTENDIEVIYEINFQKSYSEDPSLINCYSLTYIFFILFNSFLKYSTEDKSEILFKKITIYLSIIDNIIKIMRSDGIKIEQLLGTLIPIELLYYNYIYHDKIYDFSSIKNIFDKNINDLFKDIIKDIDKLYIM